MITKKSNVSLKGVSRAIAKKNSDDRFLENLIGGPLTLGDALHAIRSTLNVSQVEFAHLLGISRARLCDIEKGRRSVELETAADFARRLKHPVGTMVRLALQDQVTRAKLNLIVDVRAA